MAISYLTGTGQRKAQVAQYLAYFSAYTPIIRANDDVLEHHYDGFAMVERP
ncbi:MAG: hypothetical protein AAGF13_09605 [Pseudomonadota bacterium]